MTTYSAPKNNHDLASTKNEGNPTTNGEFQQELNKYIVEEKYINKLVSLLTTCEKSKKSSCLPTLRSIILHLNDPNLKEGKAQYRHMLPRVGKFKEVVPIDDPDTMKLINRVICLQFLKDKVLPDTLEVDAILVVTLMIKAKTLELAQDIAYDRQLMKDLFDILKNPSESKHHRNEVVLFVHQFCITAKKSTLDVYR
ncbi:Platinum sensitivity protein [Mortierella sp. GBA39]|nr:Platinum sensitivity protein [Mortierella sp. GBA39]